MNEDFYTTQPPIWIEIRPIARDICQEFHGCAYDSLDTVFDSRKIEDISRKASIIRYLRHGIDPTPWIPRDEVAALLKFV
jgi:hypothetical protein